MLREGDALTGTIRFVKAQARGNDFLVIEESLAAGRHAEMARKLCDRHTGVGADGIEFLDRRADGTLFLRLFNADGSEAELSGNGTRCVAAWLAESEQREDVALGTHGGVRRCRVVRRDGNEVWIESGMGMPRVVERRIRVAGVEGELAGAMVNVGNPHFVIFPEREDFGSHGMSWQELGAVVAVDPLFRFGTNVEFVRVLADKKIEFRIFERGCGPTESSGTGTCASCAAAIVLRGVARELTAVAPGGEQLVVWPENGAEMLLTGPAEIVCVGEARL
ncbi:MAG TPA: diaminopimelate epimerase [Acidobacteriaceae bacterium]|nr:diaminopimelate epimerase [Acidobacteriaceae bacterium]